jgi:hypothetical protein
MACVIINHPNVVASWGCCECRTFNSIERAACRGCRHSRCCPIRFVGDVPVEVTQPGALVFCQREGWRRPS